MTYKEQLADPRWQRKRLQIFERDKFTCQICLDTTTQLQVHHKKYDKTYKTLAWEYKDNNYTTLCCDCHSALTTHIELYGNDDEFNVMKVKEGESKTIVVYTKDRLKFIASSPTFCISEKDSIKIVQFLINNWLKNG